jgi:hypothetical protein
MCQIPEDFANTYCNGHRMALGSSTLSRNGTSAWGPIFLPAARLADYLTRDPDEVTETEGGALNGPTGAHPRWSIATRDGMLYTADHNYVRAGLADEVIHCGWGAGGHGTGTVDCGAPYTEEHGAHTSALSAWDYTAGKTIATMDWWASSVWIDTGTKHGVVYFATFVKDTGLHGTPAHLWYGSETCPHGYFDKRHTGVGDGASCKTSLLQIYDPLDIAASLNEEVTPYSVQPTVEATIYPTFINDVNFQDAAQDDLIMGAWYDEVDHRLYLRERMGDTRAAGSDNEDRSMIHVFQVE